MSYPAYFTAIQKAQYYARLRPVYLDTETTGLDGRAEVVEICLVDDEGQALVDTLVRPQRPIPPEATRVNGISNAMVKDAPTWPEVWPQVAAHLCVRAAGIYNAEFDIRMLRQTNRLYGLPWFDPEPEFFCIMQLYARFHGAPGRYYGPRFQSLANAGQQCGIALPNAHRARADTLLARAILHHMAAAPVF
jgi:DNA polymerase-3 subunit epsilon